MFGAFVCRGNCLHILLKIYILKIKGTERKRKTPLWVFSALLFTELEEKKKKAQTEALQKCNTRRSLELETGKVWTCRL